MKYYEEFFNPYGFGDGRMLPDGVEKYRTVYIRVMNSILEEEKSEVRLAAYDASDKHNPYRIFCVSKSFFDLSPDPTDGQRIDSVFALPEQALSKDELDEAYYFAKDRAENLDVEESFLDITVVIDEEGLVKYIENIDMDEE